MENRDPALRRALKLLLALQAVPDGLRVRELANATGQEASQVSKSLGQLERMGIVMRDLDTPRARLGWRLFTAAGCVASARLPIAAAGRLSDLTNSLGETSYLSVLRDCELVSLLVHRPTTLVNVDVAVGRTTPAAGSSAGGRAILSVMCPVERQNLIGSTPSDHRRASGTLGKRLDADLRLGWSASVDEVERGLTEVAAPVRDYTGKPVAALTVGGASERMKPRIREIGTMVAQTAQCLSLDLGYADTVNWPVHPIRSAHSNHG